MQECRQQAMPSCIRLAEIDYYKNKIVARADWEFAGVFIDDGLSGTRRDSPVWMS